MSDLAHYTQAAFLAARAQAAADIGPTPPPEMVALPGAKTAIRHDRLRAHQDTGRTGEQIVERENQRWRERHADVLAAHARWVHGPYQSAIQQLREARMREQAEQLRRRAVFERLISEHEAG